MTDTAPSRQNTFNLFAGVSLGGAHSVQPRGARSLAEPARGSLSPKSKGQIPNVKGVFPCLAFWALCLLLGLSGCATAEKKVSQTQADSRRVERKIADVDRKQRDRLKAEIFATSLALEAAKVETADAQSVARALGVASNFNHRAQSLAGMPNVGEMDTVRKLVFGLLSENAELRAKAQKAEAFSVSEIKKLQDKNVVLQQELGEKRENEREAATEAAQELGTIKEKVNSWFGLGAMFYGIKRFASWFLVLGFLFLVGVVALFFFPATAPIALAIFSGIGRLLSAIFGGLLRFLAWASEGLINSLLKLLNRSRK